MFDGDLSTRTFANNGSIAEVTFSGVTIQSSLRLNAAAGAIGGAWNVFLGGVSNTLLDLQTDQGWYTVTLDSTPVSLDKITNTQYTGGLWAIEVDGKVLVDAQGFPGGTFKKLYQNWTEQQAVVFYARIAAADLLMSALRDHAQTYSATDDYCEGTIISAFGQLWISVADAPATAFADEPALLAHPNWEKLNVSV